MAYVHSTEIETSVTATRRRIGSGRPFNLVMAGLLVGALIPLAVTMQGESIRVYGGWVSDTAPGGAGPPPDAVVLPGSGVSGDLTDTGAGAGSPAGEDSAKVAQPTVSEPAPAATAAPPAPVGAGTQRGGAIAPAQPSTADPLPAEEPPSVGSPHGGSPSVRPPLVRPPLVNPPPAGQLFEGSPPVGQPLQGSPSVREIPNPGLMIRPGIFPRQSTGSAD